MNNGIHFKPKMAINAQDLAYFVTKLNLALPNGSIEGWWKSKTNESSWKTGVGARIILHSLDNIVISRVVRFAFQATNNKAEYEVLVLGLRLALSLSVENLEAFSDSQLVVSQVNDSYKTNDGRMSSYLSTVKELTEKFQTFKITQIPRGNNELVDSIASFASVALTYPCNVELEILDYPSILSAVSSMVQVDDLQSWTTPILCYLKDGRLPEDMKEEYNIRKRSAKYTLINGEWYRRMYTDLYVRCLEPHQAERVVYEINEGTCGTHIRGRSLADMIRTQGFDRHFLCLVLKL